MADVKDPQREKFEKDFKSLFGESERPTINTYFVYDGMQALVESAEHCKNNQNKCLLDYLTGENRFWSGVSGKFSYDKTGRIERSFTLKQVKDAKFEMLQ